jgi:hypothetical protein
MSFEVLPWTNLPFTQQVVQLSGRSYLIEAKWNSSYRYWTLDIYDGLRQPIIFGLKLVANIELLRRYQLENLPIGALGAILTGEGVERVGRNNIGDTVQLVYHDDNI